MITAGPRPAAAPDPATGQGRTAGERRGGERGSGTDRGIAIGPRALLSRPLSSYYLLAGITGLLLILGLMMVLSTSSAQQLGEGLSPYSGFVKQLLGVCVGVPVMWLLAKAPPGFYRRAAIPLMVISIVLLVAVLAFGSAANGAQRWIVVAGFQIQPSEFAKLAFLLWGADLLARRERLGRLRDAQSLLMPLLPGAALLVVLIGDDLGTSFVLLMILLSLIWVIGTPGRLMFGLLGLVCFALLVMLVVQPYRVERLLGFLGSQNSAQAAITSYQPTQGGYALGSGGLWGVGLGKGLAKWGWVPNDTTDFIFAIIGEELGLIGTASVVLLYGGFAYAGLRIARRVTDPFMRLAATGATAWIMTQSLVNIGAVVGLLPITGVPLPLISAGLSSLLSTLGVIAMLLSFARHEPGAAQALAARPSRLRRLFGGLRAESRVAARASRPGVVPDRPDWTGGPYRPDRPDRPGPPRSGIGADRSGPARSGSAPERGAPVPTGADRPRSGRPGSRSRLAPPAGGPRRPGQPGVARGGK